MGVKFDRQLFALLMFVNGEIKEAPYCNPRWQFAYAENVKRRGPIVKLCLINAGKGKATTEIYMGEKSDGKSLILE